MINALKASLTKSQSRIWNLLELTTPLSSVSVKPSPGAEEPDYYTTGGFHPIALSDSFDSGKYTVLRKLGYGQYSTVWLARDSKQVRHSLLLF